MISSKDYITRLRFPLAVGVVFIHSMGRASNWTHASELSVLSLVKWLFSSFLPGAAVPLFFIIAGFLFFQNFPQQWSWQKYKDKLQSRIKTLFLPYILWNSIKFLQEWGKRGWGDFSDRWKAVGGFNFLWGTHDIGQDTVHEWGYSMGHLTSPIDVPLWFVRDLMVVCLCTPILWWLLHQKRTAFLTLGIMFILYATKSWPYVFGISGTSFFMFSIGAACALGHRDLLKLVRPYRTPLYLSFFLLMGIQVFCKPWMPPMAFQALIVATLFVNIATYINIAGDFGVNQSRPSKGLHLVSTSSFFIYAAHTVGILERVDKELKYRIHWTGELDDLLRYVLLPLCTILLCFVLFYFLHRLFPRLSAPLTGVWPR